MVETPVDRLPAEMPIDRLVLREVVPNCVDEGFTVLTLVDSARVAPPITALRSSIFNLRSSFP